MAAHLQQRMGICSKEFQQKKLLSRFQKKTYGYVPRSQRTRQYIKNYCHVHFYPIILDEIVPVSFVSHFHAATGSPLRHQLYPMLWVLLLHCIFSIPTVSFLIVFLKYSQELRDFCGFHVVPDHSKFTRFKQDFLLDLQLMSNHLVDLTELICQALDISKASMLLFDTSGVEAWVTENHPKYASWINQLWLLFAPLKFRFVFCQRNILPMHSFGFAGKRQ